MNIASAITATDPAGTIEVAVTLTEAFDHDGIIRTSEDFMGRIADHTLAAARGIGVRALPTLSSYWEILDTNRILDTEADTATYTFTYICIHPDYGPTL